MHAQSVLEHSQASGGPARRRGAVVAAEVAVAEPGVRCGAAVAEPVQRVLQLVASQHDQVKAQHRLARVREGQRPGCTNGRGTGAREEGEREEGERERKRASGRGREEEGERKRARGRGRAGGGRPGADRFALMSIAACVAR